MADKKQPAYVAPEALPGDDVYWFSGGNLSEKPQPAKVVEVGRDALTLAVFQPMQERLIVRDSVRHVDDPRPRLDEVYYAGAWCHREDYLTREDVTDEQRAAAGSRAAEAAVRAKAARQRAEAARREKEPAAAGV